MPYLKIVPTLSSDRDGNLFIRYTPTLVGFDDQFVTFACWEVAVGDPTEAHEAAREKALTEARITLSKL